MSGIINFTTITDVLASEGVINYDATAYVKGTTPRYIGKPSTYANSGVNMKSAGVYSNPYQSKYVTSGQGNKDAFLKSSAEMSAGNYSRPLTKESMQKLGLAGIVIAVGGLIFSKTSKTFKKVKVDIQGKAADVLKNEKCKGFTDKAKSITDKVKDLWVKIPKKFKIGAVTILTLVGAYKVAMQAKQRQANPPQQ